MSDFWRLVWRKVQSKDTLFFQAQAEAEPPVILAMVSRFPSGTWKVFITGAGWVRSAQKGPDPFTKLEAETLDKAKRLVESYLLSPLERLAILKEEEDS